MSSLAPNPKPKRPGVWNWDCAWMIDDPEVIWCDPVNNIESLGWFLLLSFREQSQQQPSQVVATIDQADIRGSESSER
jgi:hypothetical protein